MRERDSGLAPSLDVKLAKLTLALVEELALPDIVAVQEVGDELLLAELAEKVNDEAGTAYRAEAPPCSDRRGIRVGLLWDAARVELTEAAPLAGPEVAAAFGPTSASPGREPLLARFRVARRSLTVIANHLKSDYIGDVPPEKVAGARAACVAQRLAQARAVRAAVDDLMAGDPAGWLVVAGDLNQTAEAKADNPVNVLMGQGAAPRLLPVLARAQNHDAYTFRRDGDPLRLDHMLLSPGLAPHLVSGCVHHFNVDFLERYQYDETTARRVSDHDPLSAYFSFD